MTRTLREWFVGGAQAHRAEHAKPTVPLSYLLTPTPRALLFAVTSAASVLLALFVGFYLQLTEPAWAATTAIIVANPVPGQVLEKSVYRILGTVAGVLATILFVALFAQTPMLFIIAEALWIAGCTALSTVVRDFRSYGAVLSGYTAAILGFPSAAAPNDAFQIAVGRGSAILLGIACATLLTIILIPGESKAALSRRLLNCLADAMRAVHQALRGENHRDVLQRTAREMANLPAWVSAAQQEEPALRRSEGRIRSAILAVFDILSSTHTIDLHRRQLTADRKQTLQEEYEEPIARLRASIEQIDPVSDPGLSGPLQTVRDARTHSVVDGGGDLILRTQLRAVLVSIETALNALAQIDKPMRSSVPPPVVHRDWPLAGRNAVRVLVGISLASAIWIETAWAGGMNVVIWTGIALALLASRERQLQATFSFLRGVLAAIPVAALWKFAILPACSGFPMLAAALLPVLIISGLIVAGGPDPGFAASFGMITISSIGLSNVETFAFNDFLNTALAEIIGIGIAIWTFYVVLPADLTIRARRIAAVSVRDLARLLEQAAPPRTAHVFTTQMYDRLAILVGIGAEPQMIEMALDCLAAGGEAVRLQSSPADDDGVSASLRACAAILRGNEIPSAEMPTSTIVLHDLVVSLAKRTDRSSPHLRSSERPWPLTSRSQRM